MSKNLIYANADEFHVKSTIVYAGGKDKLTLYWDFEHTKPIYSDDLKRLFFAGGLKIYYLLPVTEGPVLIVFLSPIAFSELDRGAVVKCLMTSGNVLEFSVPSRSVSSDDGLFPAEQVSEVPSH